jgi:hypothetical protein
MSTTTRKPKPVNKAKPATFRFLKGVDAMLNRASLETGVAKTRLIELALIDSIATEEEKLALRGK